MSPLILQTFLSYSEATWRKANNKSQKTTGFYSSQKYFWYKSPLLLPTNFRKDIFINFRNLLFSDVFYFFSWRFLKIIVFRIVDNYSVKLNFCKCFFHIRKCFSKFVKRALVKQNNSAFSKIVHVILTKLLEFYKYHLF